jgi:hypothetical protein
MTQNKQYIKQHKNNIISAKATTAQSHLFPAWWPKYYQRSCSSSGTQGRDMPKSSTIKYQPISIMH